MRAKIVENQVVKFPYTISDLKADYPQKSFRRAPLEDVWASHGVVPVVEAARPAVSSNQTAVRNAEPSLVEDLWVLGWDVRDKTAEELLAELPYQNKEEAKAAVLKWADEFLAPLEEGYSQKEIQSWPVKGPAAINHLAGVATPAETIILQGEADALQAISPGFTIDQVAAAIQPKAEPYLKALAFTSSLRQIVNAQIDATTELAEIPPILESAIATATAKAQELGLPAA